MKKITSLATALAMATTFCALCTGCANGVAEQENANSSLPAVSQSAAGDEHKVILNPGWNFDGGTKKLNTIEDAGVTAADAATYRADNAYICTVAAGEELPKPTAGKSGLTFVGWRYPKDGELVTITTMPAAASLSENLYLYAHWSGSNSGNTPTPTPDPVGTASLKFKDGTVTIVATGEQNKDFKIYVWTAANPDLIGKWPGVDLKGEISVNANMSGIKFIINWTGGQTNNLSTTFTNGKTYTVNVKTSTITVS